MRIVVMEGIPEDQALRQSWNRLALKMERPEVFYTYEWAIAVQRSYRNLLASFLVAAYEGESLVGIVALARKMPGSQQLSFLTADTADYCDFLSDPCHRQKFVEGVLSELRARGIGKIALANLPADSCSVAALSRAASSNKYYLHARVAYLCARVSVGSAEDRAEVKQSLSVKKRLRRNLRDLGKRGAITVRHGTKWDEVEPLLEAFSRAHAARFLETGKISNLVHAERRAFLRDLARGLSDSGWLALSRLLVGGETAAWNYGFRYAESWFWYQPTVSNSFGNLSPGYCLLAKIIEEACGSADVQVVDMGLGDEGYKDRFANTSRETLYCELNKSVSRHVRAVVRNRTVAVIKASPGIERNLRTTISRGSDLAVHLRSLGFRRSLAWLGRRVHNSLFARDNVLFFEWPATGQRTKAAGTTLKDLDSDLLGAAAIAYNDDPATLRYLIRSAQRRSAGQSAGYALLTAEGQPVHFCWAKDFEGFAMAELDRTLHAPCANAAMIFDCFTPLCARGHGRFAEAVGLLAERLREEGKTPWIFGAATNLASLRGIEKTAFKYRFSLGRRKILFVSSKKDSSLSSDAGNSPGRSPAA